VVQTGSRGSGGKNSSDTRNYYTFTVTAVVADADFPLTMVQPRRGANLIKSVVGFQDIVTESASFNKRWRVVGNDERAGHEIVRPRVMALLDSESAVIDAVNWDANAVMVVTTGHDAKSVTIQ